MNKLSFFAGIALLSLLYGCGGKPVKTRQSLIAGKWKLQTQHIAVYVNNVPVLTSESTINDPQSTASISFNTDGSYLATSVFALNGTLIRLGQTGSAGFAGQYSLIGDTTLNLNPFFKGSFWVDTVLAPSTAITIGNKIVTETAFVDQLSSSLLTINTEIVDLQTLDFKTRTVTTKNTYNYTR